MAEVSILDTGAPCRRCKYRYGTISGYICCGYIIATQKRRPCPGGRECTVFERGRSFSEKIISHKPVTKVEKNCVRCGELFIAGTKAQYCPKCKVIAHRINSAKHYEKIVEKREPIIKTCPSCGRDFYTDSQLKSYCPECKKKYNRDQLTWRREKWLKEQNAPQN